MDYQTYIKDATRTESRIDTAQANKDSLLAALRLFLLSGQVLDLYKRQIFYGKDFDPATMGSLLSEITQASQQSVSMDKDNLDVNTRLLHATMGLATEAGEIIEALYPALQGEEFDTVNFMEELGDVNWYQAIALDEAQLNMDDVLDKNIKKLKARFPDKFTEEKAIERDIKTERGILEGS